MTQNKLAEMNKDPLVSAETAYSLQINRDDTENWRAKLEAERDQYLRLAAEYTNYRRRTEKANADAADEGKRELLMQLVSLADDLDAALASLDKSPEAAVEGVRMIHRRFSGILEANSVIPFGSKGERFDPERHEAFAVVEAGECESGTVHEEMRCGYFWKDKLFRPALVVVEQ